MLFTKLDDSPALRKQLAGLEDGAGSLRERLDALLGACAAYTEYLADSAVAETNFVQALEDFCGTDEDPIAVSLGGPIMSQFAQTLREMATFKDTLRLQTEHLLIERLSQFCNVELTNLKEVRRRFDKASRQYDQSRERVLSLKKGFSKDLLVEEEEDLLTAKMQAEQARFNLVTALSTMESRKKYLFVESVGSTMDALLRYYKQCFQIMSTAEPYVHQVLAFAHQAQEQGSRELAELAERMYKWRQQREKENEAAMLVSRMGLPGAVSPSGSGHGSSPAAGTPGGATAEWQARLEPGVTAQAAVAKLMRESLPENKVQVIKEGYLVKKGREDGGRYYFVLDSRGALYHRLKSEPSQSGAFSLFGLGRRHSTTDSVTSPHGYAPTVGFSPADDLFLTPPPLPSLSKDARADATGPLSASLSATSARQYEVVNLLTATVKRDADEKGLRCCFRVVSPGKTFTLQAENDAEREDWMESITAVIVSLLNGPHKLPKFPASGPPSPGSGKSEPPSAEPASEGPEQQLRKVEGNTLCADCGRRSPDWASLNLCVLICINCSGIHRKLGVHVSKVRSLLLDVKVWSPTLVELFEAVGNTFANSLWEADPPTSAGPGTMHGARENGEGDFVVLADQDKPGPDDPIYIRERFIFAKYVKKQFVKRCRERLGGAAAVQRLLHMAVAKGDVRAVLNLLVAADADVNGVLKGAASGNAADSALTRRTSDLGDQSSSAGDWKAEFPPLPGGETGSLAGDGRAQSEGGVAIKPHMGNSHIFSSVKEAGAAEELESASLTKASSERVTSGLVSQNRDYETRPIMGTTALHVACVKGFAPLVELLLLWGASPQAIDESRRTPFDVAVVSGNTDCAQIIASRSL